MSDALTPAFLLAALVLCIAGMAKLRAPSGAARAAASLGLPSGAILVRAFALAELATGCWCLADASATAAAVLAAFYAGFGVLALALARARATCGCFGEGNAPASWLQAVLSAVLCVVAIGACLAGTHGFGWVVQRPPIQALVLLAGTLAAAYGAVLAYTELPTLWASWSGA